jgi:UDP-N-acetylmuramyl pentapeptide phosphotransferase/UDP-N-acetylglucosamine-1-phosphate transferase
MLGFITGVIFSFAMTLIILPILIRFAKANQLYVPINYRRIHHRNISALGGLAIFASPVLSFVLFSDIVNFPDYRYIFGSGLLMYMMGFYDDLYEVRYGVKILVQTVAAAMLVFLAGVYIHFLQHYIAAPYGLLADQFTTLALMLLIINAYNLIDGIDMSAALVGFVVLSFLGVWFSLLDQFDYGMALLALAASLLAFMVYNYTPARIFMGDTGTMSIGLLMSFSLIKFDEINTLVHNAYSFQHAPAISFSLMSLIVFDLIRVGANRVLHAKSPFSPDKTHIHHWLIAINPSHVVGAFIISGAILLQLLMTIALDRFLFSNWTLILLNVLFLLAFYALIYSLRLHKTKSNSKLNSLS